MAYSSILGAEIAPTQPSGRDADLLGPSDSSDSGSDALGTDEIHADSDAVGHRRARLGDARARAAKAATSCPTAWSTCKGDEGLPEADPDGLEMTDLDADSTDEDQADER